MASNLEMMKLIFDPKTEAILQAVKKHAKTVKEIAGEIEEKPSRLYYPIQKLLTTGLLEVSEEKQVGNLIEKYYSAQHLFDDNDTMQFEGELASRNADFLLPMIMMSVNKGVALLKEDLENSAKDPAQTHSRSIYTETTTSLTHSEWLKVNEMIRFMLESRDSKDKEDSKEYTFSLLTYENDTKPADE